MTNHLLKTSSRKRLAGMLILLAGISVNAEDLQTLYPEAEAVFDLVRESPLIHEALADPEFFERLGTEPAAEDALRARVGQAAYRQFGSTRSVRVEIIPPTATEGAHVVLGYQTDWKKFTGLPTGGPPQFDPVLKGTGRDSMWHRVVYGGTDNPEAHAAFHELMERRLNMASNRRRETDPEFIIFAEKHLPTRSLKKVRTEVKDRILKLVDAFAPYGAEILETPQHGHFGAKLTDHLYLYIRDFPEDAPTRFDHDPFFWLVVSGGPKSIPGHYIPAFPGAEGFGAMATGGRGGQVIYVTTTAPDGPGSFKEALETPGKRIILFNVGGQIDLPDQTWIEHGDLTVLGFTAPGDGIEINGRLCLAADNIILRGLRFRLRPPLTKDGMNTRGRLHNIIFDHCSFAYASDELLRMIGGESSFYGFTIQYCLLGPGLAGVGDHPYGPEVGGYGTFHHNLFYNTLSRSPEVDCVLLDWRYNIMANLRSGHSLRPHNRMNMVGNYIVQIPGNPNQYSFEINDSTFFAGNLVESGDSIVPFTTQYTSSLVKHPYRFMPVTETAPQQLEDLLVPMVGAHLPRHDSTDRHFLQMFVERRSLLPHLKGGEWRPYGNENDNMELYEMWEDSDFPPPANASIEIEDSDGDGMPDAWEERHGFNPQRARDAGFDADNDGYTNVEEYLYGTDPLEYVDYTDPANNRHTLH